MIRALGTPFEFLGLVLGFLIGCWVHAEVQRRALQRFGAGTARWLVPPRVGVARWIDPFGAVAALLGGVGWQAVLESAPYQRANRWRVTALIALGPIANVAVCWAALAVLVRLGSGGGIDFGPMSLGDLLHGHLDMGTAARTVVAGIAVINAQMAVLTAIPLPPLDGARVMFLHAPRTIGWQKAEYYLIDRNYGMVAVLVLLLLPIGGSVPPLVSVVDYAAQPLLQALLRAVGG